MVEQLRWWPRHISHTMTYRCGDGMGTARKVTVMAMLFLVARNMLYPLVN